jgi:hypothetical protein
MIMEMVRDRKRWVDVSNFKDRLDEAILFPNDSTGDYFTWSMEEGWRPTLFFKRSVNEELNNMVKRTALRTRAMEAMGLVGKKPKALTPTNLSLKVAAAESRVGAALEKLNDSARAIGKLIDRVWAIEGAAYNLLPENLREPVRNFYGSTAGKNLRASLARACELVNDIELQQDRVEKIKREFMACLEGNKEAKAAYQAVPELVKLGESGVLGIVGLPTPDIGFKTSERAGFVAAQLLGISKQSVPSAQDLSVGDRRADYSVAAIFDDPLTSQSLVSESHSDFRITIGQQLVARSNRYRSARKVLDWLQEDLKRSMGKGEGSKMAYVNKALDMLASKDISESAKVFYYLFIYYYYHYFYQHDHAINWISHIYIIFFRCFLPYFSPFQCSVSHARFLRVPFPLARPLSFPTLTLFSLKSSLRLSALPETRHTRRRGSCSLTRCTRPSLTTSTP